MATRHAPCRGAPLRAVQAAHRRRDRIHRARGLGGDAGPGAARRGRSRVLALAVLLSSASAGAFNQYVERDLDARMSAHAQARRS